jgi:phosphoribosylformimino-5-aminoimidazole carboxamide ribotide isomerase
MKIFPAIDIIGGKVVRLTKGDYNLKKVYSSSPLDQAKYFESLGAEYLHVVDLDSAKNGKDDNMKIICEIAEKTSLFVETGGGVRTIDKIERYLDRGIQRVIIGTAAVKNPEMLDEAIRKFGGKIAVGVDARNSKVAVSGWTDTTDIDSYSFCKKMKEKGVRYIIYTDISKDGKLSGINYEIFKKLNSIDDLNITASGGVSSLDDVEKLNNLNIYGCIIGKAIYENRIDIKKVLEIMK